MRFFHLSDLHIGKQFYQYHLLEDQAAILAQIVEKTRKFRPDAIVIAGDVYDKPVPSGEAVTVFNRFLTALSEIDGGPEIFITAGNHDSAERLDYASVLLSRLRIHIAALPPETGEYLQRVRMTDEYGAVDFYLMPFMKPPYIRHLFEEGAAPATYEDMVRALLAREQMDPKARNVIVAHQFFTSAGAQIVTCDSEVLQAGGLDQVDVSALEAFDYGAFGHIHGPQSVGMPKFRYCGSPLKYSVSEAGHHKSLTMVELHEKGADPVITRLDLKPLRDVRLLRGELVELLAAPEKENDDYVSVILTDEQENTDARERLLDAYPHLLEVRVDNSRTRRQLTESFQAEMVMTPEEIFARFFEGIQGREMTQEESKMIQSVINHSREEDIG